MRKSSKIKTYFLRTALVTVASVALYAGSMVVNRNFHEVIPGEVYRSAQPKPGTLAQYVKDYHIRTILNLRGPDIHRDWYNTEVRESAALGLQHIDFTMSPDKELSVAEVEALIEIMRNAKKPILIHCESGTNRTSLASALYLAAVKKESEFESELQMSPLYGHMPIWFSPAYAMDRTFETVEPILGFYGS